MNRIKYGIVLTLLLLSMYAAASNVKLAKAGGTIYIRANGSVEGTDKIANENNVTYTFTDDINDSIVVGRSNIVINGNGYMLQGAGSGIGFYLSDINNVTITQTTVKGFTDGVYLRESSNNSIFENDIMNNENGILILYHSSISNIVYGNNFENNTGAGIFLSYSSDNNISVNYLTDNRYGVHLSSGATHNLVAGNILINNTYGIALDDSSGNIFYHNNFIKGEGGHVYDLGIPKSINAWDQGYPSGGNYWSDYSGVDLYTGPYQNLTEGIGSDGIGDMNYTIDGSNVDHYPLMIPWTDQTPIRPLEGQYANYAALSIIHGSIVDSLHFNLTYHKYVSPFLMYLMMQDDQTPTISYWTALNITNRYSYHCVWPITGLVANLWFPYWIETNVTIGSTVNLLNGTATVVSSRILHIEPRSVKCWELVHDEEIGSSTYIHHTFWFHKTTGLLIGEEVEVSSYQKFNITLVESNILPDYEIAAVYGSTPTIDGMIDVDEWIDASSVSFNNTEVFVKQDGSNLYVAFNVSDAPFHEQDAVGLYVDAENDGKPSSHPPDIIMGIYRNGSLVEGNLTEGTVTQTNVTGWTASFHSESNNWQAEFNITYSKIGVMAGVEKTLGVAFVSNCRWLQSYPFTWPPEDPWDLQQDPSLWGHIISTGYDWIPEFPSFLILPSFIMLMTLAIIIYKKRTLFEP